MQQSTTEPQPFVLGEKQEAWLANTGLHHWTELHPVVNFFENAWKVPGKWEDLVAAIRLAPGDYFEKPI